MFVSPLRQQFLSLSRPTKSSLFTNIHMDFHSTHVVFKDKSYGARSKKTTASKKETDAAPKKEKTEEEKAARKAEKLLRDKMKAENRNAQLQRSQERKQKEEEAQKKKLLLQEQALQKMQSQFSGIFGTVESNPEMEKEDEEINKILEKVEAGETDAELLSEKKRKKLEQKSRETM